MVCAFGFSKGTIGVKIPNDLDFITLRSCFHRNQRALLSFELVLPRFCDDCMWERGHNDLIYFCITLLLHGQMIQLALTGFHA